MRKLKKKFKFLILIMIISLISTGCWDTHDIEENDIVTATLVDKTDKGYAIWGEFAITDQNKDNEDNDEGTTTRKNIILKGEGATFIEARENIDRQMDNPLFLGANPVIIFTQKMGESGIDEFLYRVRHLPDYRKIAEILVTPEKPEDFFNAHTDNSDLVGISVENLMHHIADSGQLPHHMLSDIYEILASPNKCYFLTTIGLRDNEPAFIGQTVFYGGVRKGFIPVEECTGLTIMLAKKPVKDFEVPYNDAHFIIKTENAKRKTDAVLSEDGQIQFNLNYNFDATLLYTSKVIPVKDEMYEELSIELEKMIEKEISNAITISQKDFGLDYLNFYNVFRIKYPDAAKRIDWLSEYPKANFSVNVVVDLVEKANMDYNPQVK